MNLDRFYETFIARDLFAKVVPGGIFLLTIAWWLNDGGLITDEKIKLIIDIPSWGWPFVYGICYALGFAVQGLGEIVMILRPNPFPETYEVFLARLVDFGRRNFEPDRRAGRERLVVIKEMAGNVSLSSFISLLIWLFAYGWCRVFSNPKLFFFFAMVSITILSLWRTHIILRWRQREMEIAMMDPTHVIREHRFLW